MDCTYSVIPCDKYSFLYRMLLWISNSENLAFFSLHDSVYVVSLCFKYIVVENSHHGLQLFHYPYKKLVFIFIVPLWFLFSEFLEFCVWCVSVNWMSFFDNAWFCVVLSFCIKNIVVEIFHHGLYLLTYPMQQILFYFLESHCD